jgi:hypothetical protein
MPSPNVLAAMDAMLMGILLGIVLVAHILRDYPKLTCKLFGHQPRYGWGNNKGGGYLRIKNMATDGMGCVHADLITDCQRCKYQNYRVGRIILPK